MKRLVILLAPAALAAGQTIELSEADVAACTEGGGCRLITERALEYLVGEIARLQHALIATRKEQCT